MANNAFKGFLVIWMSFIVALTLQTIPWPGELEFLRPAWVLLIACYWVLALPHRVNVGTALVIGLLWDLILGSTLGVRGMMMSIIVYLVAINFLVLRNMALWQQAIVIGILSTMLESLVFVGEYILHEATFNTMTLWSGLVSCILWPWLFMLLRRVRRYWNIR
jgi:rod shape-determining protein MreD